jgi:hypothetical protein
MYDVARAALTCRLFKETYEERIPKEQDKARAVGAGFYRRARIHTSLSEVQPPVPGPTPWPSTAFEGANIVVKQFELDSGILCSRLRHVVWSGEGGTANSAYAAQVSCMDVSIYSIMHI